MDERRRRRAEDEGNSQAELNLGMLNRELGILSRRRERVAVVQATAGILADYPDWSEWLAGVRGGHGAAERLRELGLPPEVD